MTDGSGYIEDGREIFDDDLDSESIAAATKNKSVTKKKKKAVSENAGKGNIQYMLSSMPSKKKKEETKLDDDDVLSELISELEDTPSTSKNITTLNQKKIKLKNSPAVSIFAEKQAAKDYMKSFSVPKKNPVKIADEKVYEIKEPKNISSEILRKIQNTDKDVTEDCEEKIFEKNNFFSNKPENNAQKTEENLSENSKSEIQPRAPKRLFEIKVENTSMIEEFDMNCSEFLTDDYDMTQIIALDSEEINSSGEAKEVITEEQLLKGWETMQKGIENNTQIDHNIDTSVLPMVENDEGKKVFRFYWWDAFEDSSIQPGCVFFFGKTYCESAGTYVSCCVVVRNIERKLYLLPRTHVR